MARHLRGCQCNFCKTVPVEENTFQRMRGSSNISEGMDMIYDGERELDARDSDLLDNLGRTEYND